MNHFLFVFSVFYSLFFFPWPSCDYFEFSFWLEAFSGCLWLCHLLSCCGTGDQGPLTNPFWLVAFSERSFFFLSPV